MQKRNQAVFTFFLSYFLIGANAYSQEPLIPFRLKNSWGYTDVSGHLKIPMAFENAALFWAGYAQVSKGGKTGVIDTKGKMVIPLKYQRVEIDGLTNTGTGQITATHAIATTDDDKQGLYALPSGKLLVDTVYKDFLRAGEALFMITTIDGKQGVYSLRLKTWVAEPIYKYAEPMNDTLVVIADEQHQYFAIPITADRVGKIRLYHAEPAPLVDAKMTSEQNTSTTAAEQKKETISPVEKYNRQLFMQDGKYGFAFLSEQYAGDSILPVYDSIDRQTEYVGLLAVKKDGKWGIINSKNKLVLSIQYEGVDVQNSMVEKNIFAIHQGGKRSLIHYPSGKIVAEGYDEVRLESKFFRLRKTELWGMLFVDDKQEPVLVEPQFQAVERQTESLRLKNGEDLVLVKVSVDNLTNSYGYVSNKGKKYFTDKIIR